MDEARNLCPLLSLQYVYLYSIVVPYCFLPDLSLSSHIRLMTYVVKLVSSLCHTSVIHCCLIVCCQTCVRHHCAARRENRAWHRLLVQKEQVSKDVRNVINRPTGGSNSAGAGDKDNLK